MLLLTLLACPQPPTDGGGEAPPPGGQAGPPPGGGGAPGAAAGGGGQKPSLPIRGTISVVTVKNGSAEVPGTFDGLGGTVEIDNMGSVSGWSGTTTIDLTSWDSELELRDERIERLFFEVETHPEASFEITSLDGMPANGLTVGKTAEGATLVGNLTISGTTVETSLPVVVTREARSVTLTSSEPAVLSIESFGLNSQLAAVIKECAHESVADEVKVSIDVEVGHADDGGGPPGGGGGAPGGGPDRAGGPPPEGAGGPPPEGEGGPPPGDGAGGPPSEGPPSEGPPGEPPPAEEPG